MSTDINLGNQQITIYPYQEITSINANQILYNLIQPSVSSAKIELYQPQSTDQFGIRILAGATFIFIQTVTESGTDRNFLIKCVLEDDVELAFAKSLYWGETYQAAISLYLYANLNYSIDEPSKRYAAFSLTESKTTINADKDLIIATLLNHQYFVKSVDDSIDPNLSYYYISYTEQHKPDVFSELYKETERLTPIFDGDMQKITLASETIISGNSLITVAGGEVTLPAKVSSSLYPLGKVAADLYQVDTLRIKITKEDPRTAGFIWESSLFDKPVGLTWADSYSWTEAQILAYLEKKPLSLYDSGYIILIMLRACGATVYGTIGANYAAWGREGFNKIHPSMCYIPKKSIIRLDEQDYHSRFKLPIYETSDLE